MFRRDTKARLFVVKTVRDLQDALSAPNDTLIFVESIMACPPLSSGHRARALQEQLMKSGQVTPELQRSQGEALMVTVDTLLVIGDTAGAFGAAEEAQQIFTDLHVDNPDSTDYPYGLSRSYAKVGNVQKAQATWLAR
jgi:hypothetical protein